MTIFQYEFATYEIPFPAFSLHIRAATNFETIVDTMFGRGDFKEVHCPYGAALWPAAVGLGQVLCQRPHLVAGKRVLELGAGLGLVSLVAKKLGADVTASDFHPDMAELLRFNAEQNGLTVPYVSFDWNDESYAERYDVLLGSDLLYDSALTPLVLSVCRRLLAPGGRCILADPQRGQLMRFRDGLKGAGFSFVEHTQVAGFADQRAQCVVFVTDP